MNTKKIGYAIEQACQIIDQTKHSSEYPSKLVKISSDIDTEIKEVRQLVTDLYAKVEKNIKQKWDKVPVIGKIFSKFSGSVFDRAMSVDELTNTVLDRIDSYYNRLLSYKNISNDMYAYLIDSRNRTQKFIKAYKNIFEKVTEKKNTKEISQKEVKFFTKYYQTIKTIDAVILQLIKQNDIVIESLDEIIVELSTTKTVTKNVLMSTLTQMAIQVTQKEALQLIKDTRKLHELALNASENLAEENYNLLKELDEETFVKISVIKSLMEKLENLSKKYSKLEKESISKFRDNVKQLDNVMSQFSQPQQRQKILREVKNFKGELNGI